MLSISSVNTHKLVYNILSSDDSDSNIEVKIPFIKA